MIGNYFGHFWTQTKVLTKAMTKTMTKSRVQNVRGQFFTLATCYPIPVAVGHPRRLSKRVLGQRQKLKLGISISITSKVKPGADLFNGHQTGIGQFGENQCKFIHQVERCAHCITLLASLQYCAVCTQCMYPIWHCALYTA